MRKLLIISAVLITILTGQEIKKSDFDVCCGKVVRVENFNSKFVSSRNIDIWLPEDYGTGKKYSVLYMHDGQMLFDSTKTWNGQEWKVDEVMTSLIDQGKIKECIVVGIWNSGDGRHSDYYPKKAFELIPEKFVKEVNKRSMEERHQRVFQNGIQSDNYLKFIVEELKPFIDEKFEVLSDRNNTFIAGSSMGGLISMYAICEYPDVFAGAACISTHWVGLAPIPGSPIPKSFAEYLNKHLPEADSIRIYFDYGTETLDAFYEPGQKMIDSVMQKHNYSSRQWITKKYPGENHSERSWQKRLHIPLGFLLK